MKKLNPPIKLNHRQCLEDIINSKKTIEVKIDLIKRKPDVFKRYDEYEKLFKKENLLPILDSKFKASDPHLLSCYLSGGKKLAEVKRTIKDLQDKFSNEKCMYCQIRDPDTFDHYLPKDLYPEFCSLAINLIPCCATCNKKKDKYWKEMGQVGIINFYINSLPTVQVLFADITFSNGDFETPLVNFILDDKMGVPKATFDLIKKHYKRLELLTRFKDRVNSEFSELKRLLESYGKKLTPREKMDATSNYAAQLKLDYGINYWKAILFEELSTKSLFY